MKSCIQWNAGSGERGVACVNLTVLRPHANGCLPPRIHLDCREQKALTSLISDWQTARPNRAVVTLGGDVHIGGFTDSWVSVDYS